MSKEEGEFKKRIMNFFKYCEDIGMDIAQEDFTPDIFEILDEAKQEFPKYHRTSVGKNTTVCIKSESWDSFFEAYWKWFEKWFGGS